MQYALIRNNRVENVIIAEPDFIEVIQNDYDHIEALDTLHEQGLGVGIGWHWDETNGFTPPENNNDNDNDAPVVRHISVGSFYDRFGAEKYAILSSTDPLVQALIKDVSVRKFVDLDRPDLLQGLQLVQSKGFNIDPQAIISAEIQPHELP